MKIDIGIDEIRNLFNNAYDPLYAANEENSSWSHGDLTIRLDPPNTESQSTTRVLTLEVQNQKTSFDFDFVKNKDCFAFYMYPINDNYVLMDGDETECLVVRTHPPRASVLFYQCEREYGTVLPGDTEVIKYHNACYYLYETGIVKIDLMGGLLFHFNDPSINFYLGWQLHGFSGDSIVYKRPPAMEEEYLLINTVAGFYQYEKNGVLTEPVFVKSIGKNEHRWLGRVNT